MSRILVLRLALLAVLFLIPPIPSSSLPFDDQRINTNVSGDQRKPAAAIDTEGNFVVVWEDDLDGDGLYQIKARGFNADGSEAVSDFTVNTVATEQQRDPAVAMAADGSFVVVWEDN